MGARTEFKFFGRVFISCGPDNRGSRPDPDDKYYKTDVVADHGDGWVARLSCTRPGHEWRMLVDVGNVDALLKSPLLSPQP
jgi:hypothetical protein